MKKHLQSILTLVFLGAVVSPCSVRASAEKDSMPLREEKFAIFESVVREVYVTKVKQSMFRSYVVDDWDGDEFVVSDPYGRTNHEVGDSVMIYVTCSRWVFPNRLPRMSLRFEIANDFVSTVSDSQIGAKEEASEQNFPQKLDVSSDKMDTRSVLDGNSLSFKGKLKVKRVFTAFYMDAEARAYLCDYNGNQIVVHDPYCRTIHEVGQMMSVKMREVETISSNGETRKIYRFSPNLRPRKAFKTIDVPEFDERQKTIEREMERMIGSNND